MKILFMPLAGISHYLHLVPLAWACRAAGHEVRIAARPPLDLIIGSGLPAVRVGGAFDFVNALGAVHQNIERELGRAPSPDDLRTLPPETLRRLRDLRLEPHVGAAADMAPDLVAFARHWRPDLVVALPPVMAAPLVAAAAGAPLVRHLWGPDISRQAGFPGLGSPPGDWPESLRRLYDRYDVEPLADSAVRNIDPTPSSLQLTSVPDRVPARFIPYNGSGELPRWLRLPPVRPRVCVAWSTTNKPTVGDSGFAVPDILVALDSLDVEIVAAIPAHEAERLTTVPDGVRLVSGLPLNLLLPRCDAIVHHGGAGTLLTAAYYGVPQVVVPPVIDQMFNAGALANTGAGVMVPADGADVTALKSAAASVLFDDRAPAAADRLQAEILAQPAPSELVPILEELV